MTTTFIKVKNYVSQTLLRHRYPCSDTVVELLSVMSDHRDSGLKFRVETVQVRHTGTRQKFEGVQSQRSGDFPSTIIMDGVEIKTRGRLGDSVGPSPVHFLKGESSTVK